MRIAPHFLSWATALGIAAPVLGQSPAGPASAVTFNKDIAPLVFAHCASCHRPGEIGPFSLLSYSDARQRATQIASVTARRLMPPWKPTHGVGDFIGARALTEEQIGRFQQWVAQGAVEGNPADLPPQPEWTSGWQLGKPDLIVTMSETYVLAAEGQDVFRTFVIPIPTSAPRYVKALELRPGNPRVVHHANLGVDSTRASRRQDLLDPGPGYAGGMVPDSWYPPGHMLGWTPGQAPRPSPDGMAWRLEAGSDLVVQLHLQPSGKPEDVQVSAGLFFTDEAPTRSPIGLRLGSETLQIAAGDPNYAINDTYVLPVDVDVLAVSPHAHNLLRRVDAYATLPDGSTRPLISIADWDFRWQDVYRYAQPFLLPKGTAISMRFVYDNSESNARNPHHPPRPVVWGQNTSDEMGDLWVQVVTRNRADEATLNAHINRKTAAEDLAAQTKLLNADPTNPIRHITVAMLHLQAGRLDQAVTHLRESLRLDRNSAPTHYNLGVALSSQQKFAEAIAAFTEAVRLDPDYAEAHNNLAAMLHITGRVAEAVEHYARALALRPDSAEAHANLGRGLATLGRGSEAIQHFRQAAILRPAWAGPLAASAWVQATSPDTSVQNAAEAVRLAERAAELSDRREPTALDTLAAAYASAGRFEDAIRTAGLAIEAAMRANMSPLAVEIRKRLALYEKGQPYREGINLQLGIRN